MSAARRTPRVTPEPEEEPGRADQAGAAGRGRKKLPSLPWTVPVLIAIAVFRYWQIGQFDFISFGAAALVAMRLGNWMASYMAMRRGEDDES